MDDIIKKTRMRRFNFGNSILGFTGTQEGMTNWQRALLIEILEMKPSVMHHGMCIGADKELNDLIVTLMVGVKLGEMRTSSGIWVVGHPGVDKNGLPKKRAVGCAVNELRDEKPYLVRNVDILNESNFLIATPKSKEEELRSGTWFTIRKARTMRRPHLILYPDGEYEGVTY